MDIVYLLFAAAMGVSAIAGIIPRAIGTAQGIINSFTPKDH